MSDITSGTVYLVGAGPGDPGLITVSGLAALRAADVLLFDRLVHPNLVNEAPARAERIFVGKRRGMHAISQDEISRLLIDRARRGLRVVRLKGGDPFVFGRGGEEVRALRAAGVAYEVIPGVTAPVAVPALAGIPVTDRDHASAFAVVTGHERDGGTALDWHALVRVPTLVVLMGLERLPLVMARLIACGADRDTPAAAISNGSLPNQKTIVGTVDTLADLVAREPMPPPTTVVVGQVVRMSRASSDVQTFPNAYAAIDHGVME